MSNTVITNYTDLNGPSTKADNSVVVIVNKDGSVSVDQKLLGTLIGSDGSQTAGISVVRVGHEGRPDDATDSENEDDKVPHMTLSVDSYYDEPNSIIKYDSGAEMLQSLRIETRENSLVGFQNDHCYTSLTSPSQTLTQGKESFTQYDEPVLEITQTPPPKPVSNSKKITILEQQIIPKGKKIIINPVEPPVILKGNDLLNKPLSVLVKSKQINDTEKSSRNEDNADSSSISSSGDSISDRDSDSDYKEVKDRSVTPKVKRTKLKPRILKTVQSAKVSKLDPKLTSKLKPNKNIIRKEIKEKIQNKNSLLNKRQLETDLLSSKESVSAPVTDSSNNDLPKSVLKSTPKTIKKEKKTPAHVTALLSDMTSLFSTPDVIRRVSTDNKTSIKVDKEVTTSKKPVDTFKLLETSDGKSDISKLVDNIEKSKVMITQKNILKHKDKNANPVDKVSKSYDIIPQLDDVSLAQILQDTTSIPSNAVKSQTNNQNTNAMNSPGLAGPLSPTLDLLGGLQPEEEGLTEDLLMHVAQLVESSENLQEVIDKQVLGKVDSTALAKTPVQSPFQQTQSSNNSYSQSQTKSIKTILPRKDPIEIVRRDGRVITLPPIEAPATRASKRKSQIESSGTLDMPATAPTAPAITLATTPEPETHISNTYSHINTVYEQKHISKQYVNKKMATKKPEQVIQTSVLDKAAESQESWNSEDDPNRLWCICKQPHNNRFMICCDSCEDWFHGKCVNITKALGQQMEEKGIEWRCPNCTKKAKMATKPDNKLTTTRKKEDNDATNVPLVQTTIPKQLKTSCIVCKKPARATSIYCSDACILKHAQDSLGPQTSTKTGSELGKFVEKQKTESRVIVFERKTGRLLAGPNAPKAENLKEWLQQNPTFEVVRPSTPVKPNTSMKKAATEPRKIQTTLNFQRIPKQSTEALVNKTQTDVKTNKILITPKDEVKVTPPPKTPVTPPPKTPVTLKSQAPAFPETSKASTSTVKSMSEPRKLLRASLSRSLSTFEKAPPVSPQISRRKDASDNKRKMNSPEPIRDNVRKSLQEQMTIRMTENKGPKFTEEEIQQFAFDTEYELHELFRDVGMKYKAKYRSLMFNIKDRKNLSLWQKICDRSITPKQLVRLSPEELASQELAQWRDKEAKHQLELIKKSELDLLAANKKYVLKTHKGEEVMETKESVSTELDPSVPVEDLVTVLNDVTTGEQASNENQQETRSNKTNTTGKKHSSSRKRDRVDYGHSKKSNRESGRDSDSRKSRSSRRKSEMKEKDERSSRSSYRSGRAKSTSKDGTKEKSDSTERPSRHRSRSRGKSKRRSKSREHSRSSSRGRERSRSRARSRDDRHRSQSKQDTASEDRHKHRSRSQDNNYTKSKNDSTDSDSIERPKSAMLKEIHPEYDPHEPMITSAFSEEDLRKSREDVFEDTYDKNEDYNTIDYVQKPFVVLSTKTSEKLEKVSEAESDQEPSSTVDNSALTVWNGCINMVDVARFYVAAHEVSGNAADLEEDLCPELDIVGRINPDTVWDYIGKMKRASNKDIIILRLQAANDEEKMQYIALYSYLNSRNRLGVVKVSNTATVKDFYIVPLAAHASLPSALLPLDGPGLGDVKTHLLIAIVIRQKKKRLASHMPPKDVIPAKVARKRSHTPPSMGKSSYTPPTSPRRRAPLPLPAYTSPALSTSVKDKIAASLAAAEDEEAYSPGSSTSSGSGVAAPLPAPGNLRSKMEQLNRQIEEQKQQIRKMAQADSSMTEDEAYSPSRPMTPPAVVPLADIALPSNLQEILATIKQRSEGTADVDMRTLPLP